MDEYPKLPKLPVGTVINGTVWDGSQFRFGDICVHDPRIVTNRTHSSVEPSLEDDFNALLFGSIGSCGVRPILDET